MLRLKALVMFIEFDRDILHASISKLQQSTPSQQPFSNPLAKANSVFHSIYSVQSSTPIMLRLVMAAACILANIALAQATTTTISSPSSTLATTTSPVSVPSTSTDAPISVVSLRDIPSERPVFKMDENKINLKARGFNVRTATLADVSASDRG